MTFVITQPCIDTMDQTCVDVCPVDCIHFEEGPDRMLYIDPVECIDCGACEPVCPVTAIFTDDTVPEDQQHFTEINVLWFQDPAAARAQVEAASGGEAAPAAAAATAEPAEAPSAEEAPAAAAEAEAAAVSTEAEPVEAAPAAQPVAAFAQVAAAPPPVEHHEGVVLPQYPLPSPAGLVAIATFAALFAITIIFPGPTSIEVGGLGIGITVLLVVPLAAIFLLVFLRAQFADLAGFAAQHERTVAPWRLAPADLRRSEESRRHDVAGAVNQIAAARYNYPDAARPDLRTYVNLPQPLMALEFGGSGGEKVFPDIVVTASPGNTPVLVAQVETGETLTRDQVNHVWARLENEQTPLDIYVPSGMAARAKDYARAAGLKHVRFRTWRRQPFGITIREV